MHLAKVADTVVSTSKDERLVGFKLLLIQCAHSDGAAVDDQEVVVDIVDAGAGETVIIMKGSSVRFAANRQQTPLNAIIVGIVDVVKVED